MKLGKEKKNEFFLNFILPYENSCNVCILSQCIEYWINFQVIFTLTYQNTLFHTLFCLFFKSKAFVLSLTKTKCRQKSSLRRERVESFMIYRGESRTAATSKVEHFVIIVNGWKPLTIITKSSILDVAAVLDPLLI